MNILSFVNRPISGKDVKDWIQYHTENQTEYTRIARTLMRYSNLKDDEMYRINLNPSSTAGGGKTKKNRPDVVKEV